MGTTKPRWEEMFPDELYQKIQDEPVCYLAYGLAEPHGAYNALGLDWLKAQALVERAAQKHGVVVAPPFAWHIQEVPEFHDDGIGGRPHRAMLMTSGVASMKRPDNTGLQRIVSIGPVVRKSFPVGRPLVNRIMDSLERLRTETKTNIERPTSNIE